MTKQEFFVEKDGENERPIPSSWRSAFSKIVVGFSKNDFSLSGGIAGVSSISNETAIQIEECIHDYGEELVPLSEETWDTSACIWMGSHWDVLIDLWTAGEGRSDLVLGAQVTEDDSRYIIDIGMVYVP